VFLPTTSPSPDFYDGLRPGDNRRADSVVALKAETGAMVWSYQLVHHDVWDYDIPAQPSLATITLDGKERDVVIQGTKQGLVFVLDRDTGQPVLPVEERPTPQGGVEGEALSPTQPYPADLPPLDPDRITPDEAWGLTPWDRGACAQAISSARSEGRFTPPSFQGTLVMPFHRRRRELGRPRRRWRQGRGLCQQFEHGAPDHALPGRRLRRDEEAFP
jgi:quinoprotein glucose dehydrogenase